MICNVVLPNASLAYSSIQFYQVARVLLTPCVAILNFALYSRGIPAKAAWTLAPVCFGVGVVSWFDTTTPAKGDDDNGGFMTTTITTTTPLGVAFAMMGVVASSLYTVWIQWYHEKLECSSMQLLMNQAPISVLVMLYVIPVADDVTVWRDVGWGVYGLIGIVSTLSLSLSFKKNHLFLLFCFLLF